MELLSDPLEKGERTPRTEIGRRQVLVFDDRGVEGLPVDRKPRLPHRRGHRKQDGLGAPEGFTTHPRVWQTTPAGRRSIW
jgi:hypothetical protein